MIHLVAVTAAIITNGIMAGLFFAFTCAIAPGFRAVDDGTYLSAFRAINRAILNGWFLLVFLTAPLFAVVGVVLHPWHSSTMSGYLLLVGVICSVLTFGITATGSVPLNRMLDGAAVDTGRQRFSARRRFEERWNRWNVARTCTSIGALVFLAASIVL